MSTLNHSRHRRWIKTEEKAKDVASVWGEEFIPFLAALAVLPRTILNNNMNCTRMIWKKRMNSTYPSQSSLANQLALQGIEWIIPPKQKPRPLHFLLSLSFFYDSRSFVFFIFWIFFSKPFKSQVPKLLCTYVIIFLRITYLKSVQKTKAGAFSQPERTLYLYSGSNESKAFVQTH